MVRWAAAVGVLWVYLLLFAIAPVPGAEKTTLDRYGGWTVTTRAATGWFRVGREKAGWWLVTPAGHRFLSVGVSNVSYAPDTVQGTDHSPYREAASKKYGRQGKWAEAVVKRLREWGFNTVGAWSDPATWKNEMPYTVILDLGRQVRWQKGSTFPDVFAPTFEPAVRRAARRTCGPLANDPWLIGYFTDNELRWGPDWRNPDSLFVEFLHLDDRAPGRRALLEFLGNRYLTIGELNEEWGTDYASFEEIGRVPQVGAHISEADQDDFLRLAAQRYFKITEAAIRAVDEHHLILGCRFAGYAPRPVLEVMREHVDVVSLNHYDAQPPKAVLREIYRVTGRPVIITEFSFRARDSGLPNTRGAGITVDTQQERAQHFERYVRELMQLPMVVGYHWFEHADEPAEGRFDGENSNYGLVNIQDAPYELLVETVARVNRTIYRITGRRAE